MLIWGCWFHPDTTYTAWVLEDQQRCRHNRMWELGVMPPGHWWHWLHHHLLPRCHQARACPCGCNKDKIHVVAAKIKAKHHKVPKLDAVGFQLLPTTALPHRSVASIHPQADHLLPVSFLPLSSACTCNGRCSPTPMAVSSSQFVFVGFGIASFEFGCDKSS
jgi:hypothetical protein